MFSKETLPIKMEECDLIFNNRNSREFQLVVAEYPFIPRLKEDIEDKPIDGRSGTRTIKNNRYENRIIKISFKALDRDYLWNSIELIEDWLINITNHSLFYDRKDKCFIVKRVEIGDITKELSIFGKFEATFICEPFLTDNEPIILTSRENLFTLVNRGNFKVEPWLKIEGNGNVELKINDEILTIRDVVGYVIIDSNLMICYKDGLNMLQKMQGFFPTLKVGENIIEVSNNVEAITIKYKNLYR